MTELPQKVFQELGELFRIYHSDFKKAVAVIETLKQEFPGIVLNEMRAILDHVACCFQCETTELNKKKQEEWEQNCLNEITRAKRHIARAILDCYKITLIHYFDEVAEFRKQNDYIKLLLLDNGKFISELSRLEKIAIEKVTEAKKEESNCFSEKENSYPAYLEAILAYKEIINHITNHKDGLEGIANYFEIISKKENKRSWKFAFIAAGLGVIATLIINYWKIIIGFFQSITK